MLRTLMGDYPVTRQFLTHTDKFDFADVKGSVATAFKRVVRNLEFDVAELALVTHILAKAHGKPYRLLPFTVMARYQHPYLVYNAERGVVRPEDLDGRTIGDGKPGPVTGTTRRVPVSEEVRVT